MDGTERIVSRLSGHLKLGFPLGEQPLPTDQPSSAAVQSADSAADTVSRAASAAVDTHGATAAPDASTSVAVALPSESEADIDPNPATTATID